MQVNSTHPIFLREDGLKTWRSTTQRSHVELIRFWVTWWQTWIYHVMVKTQLTEQDSAWFYISMFVCVCFYQDSTWFYISAFFFFSIIQFIIVVCHTPLSEPSIQVRFSNYEVTHSNLRYWVHFIQAEPYTIWR